MESGLHQLLCFQPASFCPCRDEMYDTASFQKTKRVHQNAPFYADTLRYQERKNVFSVHGWFRNCRYHFCYNFYGTSMKWYYRYHPNCSISQTFAFVYPFQSLFPLFFGLPQQHSVTFGTVRKPSAAKRSKQSPSARVNGSYAGSCGFGAYDDEHCRATNRSRV